MQVGLSSILVVGCLGKILLIWLWGWLSFGVLGSLSVWVWAFLFLWRVLGGKFVFCWVE